MLIILIIYYFILIDYIISALVKAENILYIHGGMNRTHYFDDLWKFDLLRRTWEKLPQFNAGFNTITYPLAGESYLFFHFILNDV